MCIYVENLSCSDKYDFNVKEIKNTESIKHFLKSKNKTRETRHMYRREKQYKETKKKTSTSFFFR